MQCALDVEALAALNPFRKHRLGAQTPVPPNWPNRKNQIKRRIHTTTLWILLARTAPAYFDNPHPSTLTPNFLSWIDPISKLVLILRYCGWDLQHMNFEWTQFNSQHEWIPEMNLDFRILSSVLLGLWVMLKTWPKSDSIRRQKLAQHFKEASHFCHVKLSYFPNSAEEAPRLIWYLYIFWSPADQRSFVKC